MADAVLVVADEPSVTHQPAEGPADQPPAGHGLENRRVTLLYDLDGDAGGPLGAQRCRPGRPDKLASAGPLPAGLVLVPGMVRDHTDGTAKTTGVGTGEDPDPAAAGDAPRDLAARVSG